MKKGFTLVELVIVIAIVIILSIVSTPIYNKYVDRAKMTEGYALIGTIITAQKLYFTEHRYFYNNPVWTEYDPVLGMDARGNSYFKSFYSKAAQPTSYFDVYVLKPSELWSEGNSYLKATYGTDTGSRMTETGSIE